MYTFTAVVHQKTDAFVINSDITVTQQADNSLPIIVAHIKDSSDPCDHRSTTVTFANGSLHFSAAYDGPIRSHEISTFSDSDISLHTFYFSGGSQSYLCSDDGFFPIHIKKDNGDFKISIYQSQPAPQADGLQYPILATVTKTQTYADGFEYSIQTSEMPFLLLMAIFSLPFTMNI